MKLSTLTAKSKGTLAAALAAIAFTSAPASAQGVDYMAIFTAADVSLSGGLSIPEFATTLKPGTSLVAAERKFRSADWNKSMSIDLHEFLVFFKAAPKPSKAEIVFELADGYADGFLSYYEYDYYIRLVKYSTPVVNIRRDYLRADADDDSSVTLEEFIAFRKGDYDRAKISLFNLADDGDGFLSYIEYGYTLPRDTDESKVIAKFNKLDKNDDGFLTRSEWNPGVRKGSEL